MTSSTVRPIVAEVGVLPRTHGSALFTRGETQALVVATLGTGDDEQYIDSLEGTMKQNFLLHYNFPPYSVGEAGRMGSPGRREIGHGKLAWRAINPMRPKAEEFPYTIRIVSEITESNGSSSMATVCGTSLALMDAGVPMARPVAGIAMGLILEGEKFAVLSDILGDEDHLGDMDFKVAGTDRGRHLAPDGHQDRRHHRGDHEDRARSGQGRPPAHPRRNGQGAHRRPCAKSASSLPRIETMKIPTDKIREVIGTGGKVIREIVEKTGAKINIEDDGTIKIASSDGKQIEAAIKWIKGITDEAEVGAIYQGTVVKTADFGAFVNFFGAKDGLVHISQLAEQRVNKTTDVVKEGDKVWVKLLGFDERGKVRLSMKIVDQDDRQGKGAREGPGRTGRVRFSVHRIRKGPGADPGPFVLQSGFLSRDNGGGGPCEAWWRGRPHPPAQAAAPSTALRTVPLPRDARGRGSPTTASFLTGMSISSLPARRLVERAEPPARRRQQTKEKTNGKSHLGRNDVPRWIHLWSQCPGRRADGRWGRGPPFLDGSNWARQQR